MTPVFTASQSSSLLLLRQETLTFFYVIYDLTRNYSYLSPYMTYNSHFHHLLHFTFTLTVILWLYIIYHQKRYHHLPLIGGQHLYWVALAGTSSAVKLKKDVIKHLVLKIWLWLLIKMWRNEFSNATKQEKKNDMLDKWLVNESHHLFFYRTPTIGYMYHMFLPPPHDHSYWKVYHCNSLKNNLR